MKEIFREYEAKLIKEFNEIFSHDRENKPDSSHPQHESQTQDSEQARSDEIKLEKTPYYVMFCLQPAFRCYLKVFALNGNEKLSHTVFESICEGCISYSY